MPISSPSPTSTQQLSRRWRRATATGTMASNAYGQAYLFRILPQAIVRWLHVSRSLRLQHPIHFRGAGGYPHDLSAPHRHGKADRLHMARPVLVVQLAPAG